LNDYQVYQSQIDLPKLHVIDVSQMTHFELEQALTQLQTQFNLEKAPLWRFAYLTGYKDGTARIFFAAHHLIVDAVSWNIIIQDLKSLYLDMKLEEKTSSYRQWVKAVKDYAVEHADEINYWHKQCEGLPDYWQYKNESMKLTRAHFKLDTKTTSLLLHQANAAYHTEINDLLLTAFALTLESWEGSPIQGFCLEGHGREAINEHIDLNRTIGWFTTLFPVKLKLHKKLDRTIKQIKEELRAIPNKGIGYGALRYQNNSSLKTSSIPPIVFNYFGQFFNSDALWNRTFETSGISKDLNGSSYTLINVDGMVVSEQLEFYISSLLSEDAVNHLASLFKTHIEAIIHYCVSKVLAKNIEYTASDFLGHYEPYIILNKEIKDKVLILLHPGGGGIESYLNTICKYLTSNVKIILIDHYLLKNPNADKSITSIEQLAKFYLDLIEPELSKSSSIYVAGYSFGSVVAYELTQQLSQRNTKIEHLFLLSPIFTTLFGKMNYEGVYEWQDKYFPKSSDVRMSIFKCLKSNENDAIIFHDLVLSPDSGISKLSTDFYMHKLDCTHHEVLEDKNVKYIADIISAMLEE
ncbi:MAG: hypothetical protein JSS53_08580, partial [Proteobacteria bacterium]|nr:hypothetical protein [Pseudomonadota bacterium]